MQLFTIECHLATPAALQKYWFFHKLTYVVNTSDTDRVSCLHIYSLPQFVYYPMLPPCSALRNSLDGYRLHMLYVDSVNYPVNSCTSFIKQARTCYQLWWLVGEKMALIFSAVCWQLSCQVDQANTTKCYDDCLIITAAWLQTLSLPLLNQCQPPILYLHYKH